MYFWRIIKQSYRQLRKLQTLTTTAILTGVNVALHFYTIVISNLLQIGFSFLPIALTGFLYGPVVGGLMAAAGDILKYLVRPTGAFFIGFTLNAFINGSIYGFILYQKPVTIWRTFAAKLSTSFIVNLVLTPTWLSIMYGSAFWVAVSARLLKNALLLPIETIILYVLLRAIQKLVQDGRLASLR